MITIYGAGAIGGLTGACLARAGEDVLLVDKVADHVEAMNRHGLAVSGGADFTAKVRACVPADLPAVVKDGVVAFERFIKVGSRQLPRGCPRAVLSE